MNQVLKIVAALFLGGCAATIPLPDEAINSSASTMPGWVNGDTAPSCPENSVCALGVAEATPTKDAGRSAARASAQRQFVEMAFPVAMTVDYQSRRRNDETDYASVVKTRISGKVAGFETIEEFWVERVVYDTSGQRSLFDYYLLASISRDKVEALVEIETRKCREVSAGVGAEIRSLEMVLAEGQNIAGALPGGLIRVAQMRAALQDVVPCKDSEVALGDLLNLRKAMGRMISVTVDGLEVDGQACSSALAFRLSAAGRELGLDQVTFKLAAGVYNCPRAGGNGPYRCALPTCDRFGALAGSVGLLKPAIVSKRISVPPFASCLAPEFSISMSGPGSALEGYAYTEISRQLNALTAFNRIARCQADLGEEERPYPIQVSLAISSSMPTTLGHGVIQVRFGVDLQVTERFGAAFAAGKCNAKLTLVGNGMSTKQAIDNLNSKLITVITNSLSLIE